MSVRRSTGRPRACSGDTYAKVPMIMPASVAAGVVMVGDRDTFGDERAAGSMGLEVAMDDTGSRKPMRATYRSGVFSASDGFDVTSVCRSDFQ
jgi:uncharacterized NAD-dependent epimerase/dehydratase family protein